MNGPKESFTERVEREAREAVVAWQEFSKHNLATEHGEALAQAMRRLGATLKHDEREMNREETK